MNSYENLYNALEKTALSIGLRSRAAEAASEKGRKSQMIAFKTTPIKDKKFGANFLRNNKNPKDKRYLSDEQTEVAKAVSNKHKNLRDKYYKQEDFFRDSVLKDRLAIINKNEKKNNFIQGIIQKFKN